MTVYRMSQEPWCFVIGPIGDANAPTDSPQRTTYEESVLRLAKVIEPACERAGIKNVQRADDIDEAGDIPQQVIEAIRDADLVIADLTDSNPNVMYELGLRHAVGRCTLAIAEWNRLPFDVSTLRTVPVVATRAGFIEASQKLQAMIERATIDGCRDIPATRILRGASIESIPPQAGPSDAPAAESEPAAPEELPGFLDILVEMEAAMPEVTESILRIGKLIERVGEISLEGTEEVHQAEARGDNSFASRYAILRKIAQRLAVPAAEMETEQAKYATNLAAVDRGVTYLIDRMKVEPELLEEAGGFPAALLRMDAAATSGFESNESLAATMESLAPISREIRAPTQSLAFSLRQMKEVSAPIHTWGEGVRQAYAAAGRDVPDVAQPADEPE